MSLKSYRNLALVALASTAFCLSASASGNNGDGEERGGGSGSRRGSGAGTPFAAALDDAGNVGGGAGRLDGGGVGAGSGSGAAAAGDASGAAAGRLDGSGSGDGDDADDDAGGSDAAAGGGATLQPPVAATAAAAAADAGGGSGAAAAAAAALQLPAAPAAATLRSPAAAAPESVVVEAPADADATALQPVTTTVAGATATPTPTPTPHGFGAASSAATPQSPAAAAADATALQPVTTTVAGATATPTPTPHGFGAASSAATGGKELRDFDVPAFIESQAAIVKAPMEGFRRLIQDNIEQGNYDQVKALLDATDVTGTGVQPRLSGYLNTYRGRIRGSISGKLDRALASRVAASAPLSDLTASSGGGAAAAAAAAGAAGSGGGGFSAAPTLVTSAGAPGGATNVGATDAAAPAATTPSAATTPTPTPTQQSGAAAPAAATGTSLSDPVASSGGGAAAPTAATATPTPPAGSASYGAAAAATATSASEHAAAVPGSYSDTIGAMQAALEGAGNQESRARQTQGIASLFSLFSLSGHGAVTLSEQQTTEIRNGLESLKVFVAQDTATRAALKSLSDSTQKTSNELSSFQGKLSLEDRLLMGVAQCFSGGPARGGFDLTKYAPSIPGVPEEHSLRGKMALERDFEWLVYDHCKQVLLGLSEDFDLSGVTDFTSAQIMEQRFSGDLNRFLNPTNHDGTRDLRMRQSMANFSVPENVTNDLKEGNIRDSRTLVNAVSQASAKILGEFLNYVFNKSSPKFTAKRDLFNRAGAPEADASNDTRTLTKGRFIRYVTGTLVWK